MKLSSLMSLLAIVAPATAFAPMGGGQRAMSTSMAATKEEFQRSLLAARLKYEGSSTTSLGASSSGPNETFQRSLLAQQLKYNKASSSAGEAAAAAEAQAAKEKSAAAEEAEKQAAAKLEEEKAAAEAQAAADKAAAEAQAAADEAAAEAKAAEEKAAAEQKAAADKAAAEAKAAEEKAAAEQKAAEEKAAAEAKAAADKAAAEAKAAADKIAAEEKAIADAEQAIKDEEARKKLVAERKIADEKAAIEAKKRAEREKIAAAKRAEELKVALAKDKEEMDALIQRTDILKGRAETLRNRILSDFSVTNLLPSSETISDATSAITTFKPKEAALGLKSRGETSAELVTVVASGAANTVVDGIGAGIELADALRSDEELSSVVTDALGTAGAAAQALVGPDPYEGNVQESLKRKAKIAAAALDSFGVAAYASLCGLVGYSQAGTPVAESASRAVSGFVRASSATVALGLRSFDTVSEKTAAASEQAARIAQESKETAAIPAVAPAAVVKEEPKAAPTPVIVPEVVQEEPKAEAAPEKSSESEKKTKEQVQRSLLAARLKYEKKE